MGFIYEKLTGRRLPSDIHESVAYNTWRTGQWLSTIVSAILVSSGLAGAMMLMLIYEPEKVPLDKAIATVFVVTAIVIVADVIDTGIRTYNRFGEIIGKGDNQ